MSNTTKVDEVWRKVENWWENEQRKGVDIFRDTGVRYCGYANEVGESFRPLIHKTIVHSSYAIAIVYVVADCVDKTIKTYQVRAACSTSFSNMFPIPISHSNFVFCRDRRSLAENKLVQQQKSLAMCFCGKCLHRLLFPVR